MSFSRQARLIGADAHARLGNAQASIRSEGFAAVIEQRYLEGAGVKLLRSSEAAKLRSSDAFEDLDPAARDVAVGAMNALATIRELLADG